MPSRRRAFSIQCLYTFHEKDFCNMLLEECLVSFNTYGDGQKYRCVVICMGNMYGYFVGKWICKMYKECAYVL